MHRRIFLSAALALLAGPTLAVELGDDGLHKPDWLQDTFLDLSEDLADATDQGRRLMYIIEQRGCIYCTEMHEEVFPQPAIDAYIRENYYVVQLNMFGDREVTDFDGTTLPEKDMVARWGALFTPTMMFFPETVDEAAPADDVAVAVMPGAFGPGTTLDLLTWIVDKGYDGDEAFQKYHARMIEERGATE